MSNLPSVPEPTPAPCPECGSERVLAVALNSVRAARADAGFLARGSSDHNSEFWALVCKRCGHTTFYAKNPDRL